MSDSNIQPGVIVERDDLLVLDTRATEWIDPPEGEMFHGTGAKFRALTRHPDGWARIYQVFLPPGIRGVGHGGAPDRHYHRTVQEWVYVIFGELSLIEFDGAEDLVGQPVTLKAGYFLERKPGSVFGLDPDRPSPTGAMLLEWRTGPGSSTSEAGSDAENVTLAFPS
jgi:hypothetical protein